MGHKYKLSSITVDVSSVSTISNYKVGEATVHITSDGKYLVDEPGMAPEGEELYDQILKKIDMKFSMDVDEDDPDTMLKKFDDEFWDTTKRLNRHDEAQGLFKNVKYYTRRDVIGYGLLDVMMSDDSIEDILCSSFGRNIRVNHNRYSGRFHTLETNVSFPTPQDMEKFIQKIYGKTGSEPTESRPISVTYMDDGSRISCTFGRQISKPGPVIAIRKFPKNPLTITNMMESGTISAEAAAYLWTLLDAKAVGMVIGITGSGKTTLLSTFMTMLNPRWRILTIEDTLELQIPHTDWVRYHTRKSYGMMDNRYDITIRDLIDSSLTQKPDFEVIGEIRLNDMDSLFQSVGTGHGGLTSFHASSPQGAITRMRGNKISDGEIALTWFVVYSRSIDLEKGRVRRVDNISEVTADPKSGEIQIKKIYKYDIKGDRLVAEKGIFDFERYRDAINMNGTVDWESDFETRVRLLNDCLENKAHNHRDVFGILGKYYDRENPPE